MFKINFYIQARLFNIWVDTSGWRVTCYVGTHGRREFFMPRDTFTVGDVIATVKSCREQHENLMRS